jgi:hypothetical protein
VWPCGEPVTEPRDFMNNPVDFDVDMGGCEEGGELLLLLSKMRRAEAEVTSPEDVVGRDVRDDVLRTDINCDMRILPGFESVRLSMRANSWEVMKPAPQKRLPLVFVFQKPRMRF